MKDETSKSSSADSARPLIHYSRLTLEIKGGGELGQAEPEPVLQSGEARVVRPHPGCVIEGILVDCPDREDDTGWVVLDTASGTVAVESPALHCLMIEHDPCHLELVAISVPDSTGQVRWDWEAYEISPNGPRMLVSDPPGPRGAPKLGQR